MIEEKRLHNRYPFLATASLYSKTSLKENKKIAAFVANISQTGIGLYISDAVGPGEKITVEITSTDVTGEKIVNYIEGMIAWEFRCGNHFCAGIFLSNELLFVQI